MFLNALNTSARTQFTTRLFTGAQQEVVQVAQVHKLNIGLLFNINFNNINLFN